MEGKILVLGFDKFHSDKSNRDLFKARFVNEGVNFECFITPENYEKFMSLKIQSMKEYTGKFRLSNRYDKNSGYSRINIELIDIK